MKKDEKNIPPIYYMKCQKCGIIRRTLNPVPFLASVTLCPECGGNVWKQLSREEVGNKIKA